MRGLDGGGEHARGAVEAMREDACHDTHQELVRVGDDFVRCDTSHARLLVLLFLGLCCFNFCRL